MEIVDIDNKKEIIDLKKNRTVLESLERFHLNRSSNSKSSIRFFFHLLHVLYTVVDMCLTTLYLQLSSLWDIQLCPNICTHIRVTHTHKHTFAYTYFQVIRLCQRLDNEPIHIFIYNFRWLSCNDVSRYTNYTPWIYKTNIYENALVWIFRLMILL